jgi:uncharacterized membrane protein
VDSPSSQDAEHLRLLSIFHYVVAAMMALWGCFPIIHVVVGAFMAFSKLPPGKAGEPSPALFGWLFMLVGGAFVLVGWTLAVCTFLAGRNLAKRRRHLFCIVVAGIMAATCMPFGTVLGVFTIIVLMRPTVKEAFGVTVPGR